jgi:hypothetical protein
MIKKCSTCGACHCDENEMREVTLTISLITSQPIDEMEALLDATFEGTSLMYHIEETN